MIEWDEIDRRLGTSIRRACHQWLNGKLGGKYVCLKTFVPCPHGYLVFTIKMEPNQDAIECRMSRHKAKP